MTPSTVKIKDQYSAAFLLAGKVYPSSTDLDPSGRIVWFTYENGPELQERLLAFSINQTVGVQDFVNSLHQVRQLIYNQKGGVR